MNKRLREQIKSGREHITLVYSSGLSWSHSINKTSGHGGVITNQISLRPSNAIGINTSGLGTRIGSPWVTRVNSTNVLDEGLRIGEIGRRMNSKVKLVEKGVYRK
jgi:hypothetical protein